MKLSYSYHHLGSVLVPFRTFRGSLFPKPVTGQELFLAIYSIPTLVKKLAGMLKQKERLHDINKHEIYQAHLEPMTVRNSPYTFRAVISEWISCWTAIVKTKYSKEVTKTVPVVLEYRMPQTNSRDRPLWSSNPKGKEKDHQLAIVILMHVGIFFSLLFFRE